jgi:hypothetical protein
VLRDRRNTGASDVLIEGDEVEEAIWADDRWAPYEEEIARVFVEFMRRR